MDNLHLIRSQAALRTIGANPDLDRSAISKLPALIINNGLLPAASYCQAESSGEGRSQMKIAMDSIATHLTERKIVTGANSTANLITKLSEGNSDTLRRATTEALHYFAFLKRFAKKKSKESEPVEPTS